MSVIISPITTNAGLGVFTPSATGIEFTFTHVAVGTGTSAASSADTALENEIARFPIAGGGMVTGGHAVSINALITNHQNANPQNYAISEIGFFGVNSHGNTILFSIHRQSTAIVSKVSGADISAPFVMGLAALPVNNMTVQIDTNASAMLALLGQHTASNHPHTQYKRILDNSERLKIAVGVDGDDAVSKGQLDAEATERSNTDIVLSIAIAAENTGRENEDVALSDRINTEATTRAGVDSALAGQIAQEVSDRQADVAARAYTGGDVWQPFNVAAATEEWQAVRKSQLTALEQSLLIRIFGVLPALLVIHTSTFISITLQPNKTMRVFLLGAGGGGGGRYENGHMYAEATDGGDTILRESGSGTVYINAKGGTKGTNSSRWGNNSYSGHSGHGVAGITQFPTDGVKNLIFVATNEKGTEMLSGQEYQQQAYSEFYGKGRGGTGIVGYTNNPAGGNGAGGSYCEAVIYNCGNFPLTLDVVVGAKGWGAHSDDGYSSDGTEGHAVIVLGF